LVKWVSQDKKDKRVSFHSKEINVTGINEYLFDNPTISTASVSATLSAGKSFDFFRSNLDLDRLNTSYEVISPSPFNLKEQELWFLPKNALSASKKDTDGEEYNRMVAENLSKLLSLSGGGMLALFTSYKAMQEAYNMVSFSNPHTRILLQGDKPRKKLIEDFSDDMDSSLFGTRSFFTGVDVQGKSLRVLVIDKLPFENPSDPVTRTLSSGPSGFYNYSIPNMLMMLKQIIGRGVRSKTDKCAIVFFDKRISKSSYSKIIKRTFESSGNHAPRTTSIARVQDFLDNYK
jgi:ATP-dependent DNA helicase DinG